MSTKTPTVCACGAELNREHARRFVKVTEHGPKACPAYLAWLEQLRAGVRS